MTSWDKMLVSIANRHCQGIIFTSLKRSTQATIVPERYWNQLRNGSIIRLPENHQLLERLEIPLWRSKDWGSGQASLATQACALAATAARHPRTSAMHAIECERGANGIERGEYTRKWLRTVLDRSRTLEPGKNATS